MGKAAQHRPKIPLQNARTAQMLFRIVGQVFQVPPQPTKKIYDLVTCRFIREAKDVLFFGPPQFLQCPFSFRHPMLPHLVMHLVCGRGLFYLPMRATGPGTLVAALASVWT